MTRASAEKVAGLATMYAGVHNQTGSILSTLAEAHFPAQKRAVRPVRAPGWYWIKARVLAAQGWTYALWSEGVWRVPCHWPSKVQVIEPRDVTAVRRYRPTD